jgi:hypothetical protein
MFIISPRSQGIEPRILKTHKRKINMTDHAFNNRMDKLQSKGIRFACTPINSSKRMSEIPYGYFKPSLWESFKRIFGVL